MSLFNSQGGVDCNGHGTHCSGTTSGATWGIAKNSAVYGVRVLSCLGSGSTAGVVEGISMFFNFRIYYSHHSYGVLDLEHHFKEKNLSK